MHREPLPLFRTLERKQAYVLGVDDATFVAEVRGFLRWALSDLILRTHLTGLLDPPPEVARFVEAAPRLVADAGDVVNWLRAKEPAICTHVASERDWREFDAVVTAARDKDADVADRADFAFALLRATREGVGLSFGESTDEEIVAAWRAASDLTNLYEHHAKERDAAVLISPGCALMQLVALCSRGDAPIEGMPHWTDFARKAVGFGALSLDDPASARNAFRRFVEGLFSSLEGSLPGQRALLRFKERTAYFNRERLRAIARTQGEPALTMELGKYLYDAGLPIVVAGRSGALGQLPIREPATMARGVLTTKPDQEPVLRALQRLYADLRSLDAASFEVDEGLVAIFCLEGPLLELPGSVRTERFTIHAETIDLRAEGSPVGAKPVRIEVDEAVLAAT